MTDAFVSATVAFKSICRAGSDGGRPALRVCATEAFVLPKGAGSSWPTAVLVLIVAGVAAGCSAEQLYGTGRLFQRNQCLHMPGEDERERCMANADKSYDQYRKERDSVTR